ncbi:PP2C family protein-serine/threonine phosphatase [Umezawaea tangerina]|uniref:Protein phosphatase n=1 Tax=Umezawaea tangerina TaxID=84725 RepID=A0A2T0SZ66_9PSEU|nr:protein phosphatase 2C domain-containing protein [Umezawaea tangerina]PRY38697.1 protein phosphatase [Umezawaea tangerina]
MSADTAAIPLPDAARMTGTTCESASRRGPRSVNADALATATDPTTGQTAFVVADGIGDHLLAARASRTAALVAARVGARRGARAGIMAAQRELVRQFPQPEADTVLVVAVLPAADRPDGPCDIAWVGDCRAYRWNGRMLHLITTDHTLAEFFRARGNEPTPRMEHIVTTSVRTVRPADMGHAKTGSAVGRLLLSTDGMHKSLDITTIKTVLADSPTPGHAVETMVDTAYANGGRDNATALVADRVLLG